MSVNIILVINKKITARIANNMQLYFAEKLHEAISQTRPDYAAIIQVNF